MTLGEFRELTESLGDDVEIQATSSFDEDLEKRMDVSEVLTPDFYYDPIDDVYTPIIVFLFNEEKRLEDI